LAHDVCGAWDSGRADRASGRLARKDSRAVAAARGYRVPAEALTQSLRVVTGEFLRSIATSAEPLEKNVIE
jgi:hypothetical protein